MNKDKFKSKECKKLALAEIVENMCFSNNMKEGQDIGLSNGKKVVFYGYKQNEQLVIGDKKYEIKELDEIAERFCLRRYEEETKNSRGILSIPYTLNEGEYFEKNLN